MGRRGAPGGESGRSPGRGDPGTRAEEIDGPDRVRPGDVARARPRLLRPCRAVRSGAAWSRRSSGGSARWVDPLHRRAARRADHRRGRSPQRVLVQRRAGLLRAHRHLRRPRMVQEEAEAPSTRCSRACPRGTPLHEALANGILERGLLDPGFDLAFLLGAPLDHAFLSPVNTMYARPDDSAPGPDLGELLRGAAADGPPAAWRLGRHIAKVVAASPWDVAIIGTGGLSHFPELALSRVGETDTVLRPEGAALARRGRAGAAAPPSRPTSCTRRASTSP